jgi:integrase
MSVRKRNWTNGDGSVSGAWVVTYTDRAGKRRLKSFDRKKDADNFESAVSIDVRTGIHVPDSQSIMVVQAAKLWLESCEGAGLERTTVDAYRQHVELHIVPLLGAVKLSQLSVPMVRSFEDALRKDRSPAMVRKIRSSLGSLLADAQERGLVGQNVVRNLRANRRPGKEARADKRQKGKLKIGVDIPAPEEVKATIAKLGGRWRPLLLTAIFTGLRASELRGLRWTDIDLKHAVIHVRQRADRFGVIGPLKSEAGERTVPLPPLLVNALREYCIACPKGELGLAFPNGNGNVENYSNIVKRGLIPTLLAAGVTVALTDSGGKQQRDKHGNLIVVAKYTGLHSLRHFYASWCINRRVDGGLELPLKLVQARLGHASIQMTADRYGHLFPSGDDGAELAAAEKAFLV